MIHAYHGDTLDFLGLAFFAAPSASFGGGSLASPTPAFNKSAGKKIGWIMDTVDSSPDGRETPSG